MNPASLVMLRPLPAPPAVHGWRPGRNRWPRGGPRSARGGVVSLSLPSARGSPAPTGSSDSSHDVAATCVLDDVAKLWGVEADVLKGFARLRWDLRLLPAECERYWRCPCLLQHIGERGDAPM